MILFTSMRLRDRHGSRLVLPPIIQHQRRNCLEWHSGPIRDSVDAKLSHNPLELPVRCSEFLSTPNVLKLWLRQFQHNGLQLDMEFCDASLGRRRDKLRKRIRTRHPVPVHVELGEFMAGPAIREWLQAIAVLGHAAKVCAEEAPGLQADAARPKGTAESLLATRRCAQRILHALVKLHAIRNPDVLMLCTCKLSPNRGLHHRSDLVDRKSWFLDHPKHRRGQPTLGFKYCLEPL
mmetsp:Transcript_86594/g.279570  ORF Transcript_86594/g.279570 Transcript_86594/m.279570 type:complete len:235 (+) Transcript_86594:448-1152(+)